MEKDKLIHGILWSVFYLIVYGVLSVVGNFLFPVEFLIGCGLIGGVYILINAFFIRYKRERLFVNGLLSAFAVLCLGILIGKQLKFQDVLALGAAISIIDILSFTKHGKHTTNAKAMSNIHFMSKLIVYGKEKNDVLVPTCGIGDYFYYSMWISGIHTISNSIYAYLLAVCTILLGSCIHYAIIMKLSRRENYKGFPGTVFPFLCIAVQYTILHFLRC
ncbi:hypothetical protein JQM66_06565 [Oscillibacter valericigenes]|uniref:hypothetical protein n=1 Tax=Oscillibacter valericigenes TaxID=351091 RepID=UPI001F40FF3B|nr:hypothetical protein [Oscillibacter valericigenes]MCF2664224.1 hypothetical protein [Oscillibacter valericigenes]